MEEHELDAVDSPVTRPSEEAPVLKEQEVEEILTQLSTASACSAWRARTTSTRRRSGRGAPVAGTARASRGRAGRASICMRRGSGRERRRWILTRRS